EYAPGAETRYSDLGVILTGKIIEKISGQPLDVFCKQNIFEPLGMHETFFNPPEIYWPRIPPTEKDPWRGRVVHGVVHDENAFALGGVAGHAGLFSTARDLAKLLQMLLNGGEYNGVKLLSVQVINKFTSRQDLTEGSTRAIGWDTRSEENSSSGHFMSMRAFGHTGFTGNSVWIDPEKNLFVILLSNRVHPSRENRKIYRFRPVLHDAVMQGVIEH
ncbi:MAG: serine hydrolase domain-containing protein, partial [bacterium]